MQEQRNARIPLQHGRVFLIHHDLRNHTLIGKNVELFLAEPQGAPRKFVRAPFRNGENPRYGSSHDAVRKIPFRLLNRHARGIPLECKNFQPSEALLVRKGSLLDLLIFRIRLFECGFGGG